MQIKPISGLRRPGLMTAMALSGALLAACGQQGQPQGAGGPVEVGTYEVQTQKLALTTELSGRTSAYQVSEVRPQVNGIVQRRLFVEGADVKAGQSLYQIDPAVYQVTFDSAKAALAKAEATLSSTRAKASRYDELVAIKAVSQQDQDDAQASLKQALADVETAKANLEAARINLAYTQVAAPISGRIGKSTVTPGALLTANQTTALTTIQQLDPMYVDVTQSSAELLRLKREWASGKLKRISNKEASVRLILEDGSEYPLPGKLQFSDVTVDQGTGTLTLRAVFPNPKGDLLPGMYVRAVLEEGTASEALLVPQQGVSRDTKGNPTAMVLNGEGKVEARSLKTERTVGDKWLVSEGLQAGDQLIVEGLQKIQPGIPAKGVPVNGANANQSASPESKAKADAKPEAKSDTDAKAGAAKP
ncbi:MAG: efflux RND transporter periplasmic adaptor subunit [Zoogloea sp.]|uniref:efflux RND transporter periplasmic adaptor subunit n=1 Tax=Zoogloea sp. TaxID=49181 RepID=UPI003F36EA34